MSLIDRLKDARRRIVDLSCPQRVVFVHVAKCGGTSVARALRWRYLPSQATINPESSYKAVQSVSYGKDAADMIVEAEARRRYLLAYLMHEDVRCIAAHVHFDEGLHRAFANRYRFITLLREPEARFLSHYNWSAAHPDGHFSVPDSFDTFLSSWQAQMLGAEYASVFSGVAERERMRSDETIARAIENLKSFDHVGRLDALDDFERAVRALLGVRVRFGHENPTRAEWKPIKLRDLTESQRARVEEICAPDRAVWNGIFPAG